MATVCFWPNAMRICWVERRSSSRTRLVSDGRLFSSERNPLRSDGESESHTTRSSSRDSGGSLLSRSSMVAIRFFSAPEGVHPHTLAGCPYPNIVSEFPLNPYGALIYPLLPDENLIWIKKNHPQKIVSRKPDRKWGCPMEKVM